MANCQYCGNPVPPNANNCPSCGAQVQQQFQQQQFQQPVTLKSPGLATFLSCLVTGLGQMYNGQVAKGIVMLLAAICVGAATAGVGATVIWIVAMVDAHKIAGKINSGRAVGAWEF